MTVNKVIIFENDGNQTPAFYIHNQDYTYNLFVDINGGCRQNCNYKYQLDKTKLKI